MNFLIIKHTMVRDFLTSLRFSEHLPDAGVTAVADVVRIADPGSLSLEHAGRRASLVAERASTSIHVYQERY